MTSVLARASLAEVSRLYTLSMPSGFRFCACNSGVQTDATQLRSEPPVVAGGSVWRLEGGVESHAPTRYRGWF